MKHAFVMNCHLHLAQAARSTALLRRHWGERSGLLFYYDGKHDYDRDLFERVRGNCDRVLVGPYEADKCLSIFNALNTLIAYADDAGYDVVSFLHEDMIPLYRDQFYAFVDRFAASGKVLSYSKVWPTVDYIDYCNLHIRVREARELGLFPMQKAIQNYNFNEAQTTLWFNHACPDWRARAYPMWTMVWPLTRMTTVINEMPSFYLQTADKVGHAVDGHFTFHNYVPETSVVHVNDDFFWDNYETLSDIGPRPSLPAAEAKAETAA